MTSDLAQRAALAALSRPVRRRHGSAGDGIPCPTDSRHGRTFVMRSGAYWCPNLTHDGTSPAIFYRPAVS